MARSIASSSLLTRKWPQPETPVCIFAPPISSSVTVLADHHLRHPRRAQVHRGVAVAHDHDVAEGRDVGAAGGAGAEEQADLRHLAGEPHLVVEDAPGAAAAGEHLHLVGDPRPGRVDQVDHRHLQAQRPLLDAEDLLDRLRAPGAGLDGRVVGHQGDAAAVDRGQAGDDAVGAEPLLVPVGQQPPPRRRSRRRPGARPARAPAACPARRSSRGGAAGRRRGRPPALCEVGHVGAYRGRHGRSLFGLGRRCQSTGPGAQHVGAERPARAPPAPRARPRPGAAGRSRSRPPSRAASRPRPRWRRCRSTPAAPGSRRARRSSTRRTRPPPRARRARWPAPGRGCCGSGRSARPRARRSRAAAKNSRDLARVGHPGGVAEADLLAAGGGEPLGDLEDALGRHLALVGAAEGGRDHALAAQPRLARGRQRPLQPRQRLLDRAVDVLAVVGLRGGEEDVDLVEAVAQRQRPLQPALVGDQDREGDAVAPLRPRPAPPRRRRAAGSRRAARTRSPRAASARSPRACRSAAPSPPSGSSPARSGSRRGARPRGCGRCSAARSSRPRLRGRRAGLADHAPLVGADADRALAFAHLDVEAQLAPFDRPRAGSRACGRSRPPRPRRHA